MLEQAPSDVLEHVARAQPYVRVLDRDERRIRRGEAVLRVGLRGREPPGVRIRAVGHDPAVIEVQDPRDVRR